MSRNSAAADASSDDVGSWSAAGSRRRACAQSAGSSALASRYRSAISAPVSGQAADGSISVGDIPEVAGVRRQPLTQCRRAVRGGADDVAVSFAGDRGADPAPQRADLTVKLAEAGFQLADPRSSRRPVEADGMLVDRLHGLIKLR